MTCELTLTGQVLPIGGLKEKALAAQDAGIKRVIAPKLNEQDIEDIPEHLRKDIEFIFVERIEEVLEHALEPESGSPNGAGPGRAARGKAAAGDGVRARRKATSDDGVRARKPAGGVRAGRPARAKGAGSDVKAKRRRSK
jgi:Lon protease (S16) C-terminal proteolytic domain